VPGQVVEEAALRPRLKQRVRRYGELYLMILPIAAFFLVFRYVPMGGSVIAFNDESIFQGIWKSPRVGLDHFSSLYSSEVFRRALRNTLVSSIGRLIVAFPVPRVFAILLDELRLRASGRVVQTVRYPSYAHTLRGIYQGCVSCTRVDSVIQPVAALLASEQGRAPIPYRPGLTITAEMWTRIQRFV
jgi:hypothetical protein